MLQRVISIVLIASLGLSCAIPASSADATVVSGTDAEQKLELDFIDPSNQEVLIAHAARVMDDDYKLSVEQTEMDRAAFRVCGLGDATPLKGQSAIGIVLELLKPVVKFVVNQINEKLQKKLKEYTAVYAADDNVSFYRTDLDENAYPPVLRYTCFRFTRRDKDGVAVDLLGAMKIEEQSVLRIRPVRLYMRKAIAQSKDNVYGVSASMSGTAVWRKDAAGKSADNVVQVTLLAEKVKLEPEKPFYKLYGWKQGDSWPGYDKAEPAWRQLFDQGWADYVAAPLPPWSTYGNVEFGPSAVHATVTMTEAGNVPWLLKNAAAIFDGNKDEIAGLLEKAIDKLKPDDESKNGDQE